LPAAPEFPAVRAIEMLNHTPQQQENDKPNTYHKQNEIEFCGYSLLFHDVFPQSSYIMPILVARDNWAGGRENAPLLGTALNAVDT
jgi:hypothetical protein